MSPTTRGYGARDVATPECLEGRAINIVEMTSAGSSPLSPATQSLSSIQIEARDGYSERLRGFEIHDQLELGQLLDGEIESVLALNIPELAQARSQRPTAGCPIRRGSPRSLCRTPIRGLGIQAAAQDNIEIGNGDRRWRATPG